MKTRLVLLPFIALLLAACDQGSEEKNAKPAAATEDAVPAADNAVPAQAAKTETAPLSGFKTAAEALPHIQSQLPYDTADSSFRSVSLENGSYRFAVVIKGVEDAAAFRASHNMEALTAAYRQNVIPFLCAREPLQSLWQKKKIRGIHLDYQDEHAQAIMQIDFAAADCNSVAAIHGK